MYEIIKRNISSTEMPFEHPIGELEAYYFSGQINKHINKGQRILVYAYEYFYFNLAVWTIDNKYLKISMSFVKQGRLTSLLK